MACSSLVPSAAKISRASPNNCRAAAESPARQSSPARVANALAKSLRAPITSNVAQAGPSKIAPKGLDWQPWSPEAVAQARSAGRPVVVDFTAKWCPTCNTIIKPSFENSTVQKRLKDLNAVVLVADYTLRPDAITAELKRFQRAGVPLVLVYSPNPKDPPMVFDLVWPGSILDALSRATQQTIAREARNTEAAQFPPARP